MKPKKSLKKHVESLSREDLQTKVQLSNRWGMHRAIPLMSTKNIDGTWNTELYDLNLLFVTRVGQIQPSPVSSEPACSFCICTATDMLMAYYAGKNAETQAQQDREWLVAEMIDIYKSAQTTRKEE